MKLTCSHVYLSAICALFLCTSCNQDNAHNSDIGETEKESIKKAIEARIEEGTLATVYKDIDLYMKQFPEDLEIYDESGEIITRERQQEYALRDWAIIDTTFVIDIKIDSMNYCANDSVLVYTSQKWERLMYRQDGITTDTVLTTQIHEELWKLFQGDWYVYEIIELGGEVFINGLPYEP